MNTVDITRDIENDFEYSIDLNRRYNRNSNEILTNDEIEKYCRYLENPTNSGIWIFNLNWMDYGGISGDIIKQIQLARKGASTNKIKNSLLWEREMRDFGDSIRRLTFIGVLFLYMYANQNRNDELIRTIEINYRRYTNIFQLIDIKEIFEKYKEAYKYFIDNIWFNEYNPSISSERLNIGKYGKYFLLTNNLWDEPLSYYRLRDENGRILSENQTTNITFASITKDPLEKLDVFYSMLGKKSENSSIRPVFSPEEEVYKPYVQILKNVLHNSVNESDIKVRFEKGIKEYIDEDYAHAISTMGVNSEDILVQIFETIYREVCPRNLTLGQLSDLIEEKAGRLFTKNDNVIPDIKDIHSQITRLHANKTISRQQFLAILRQTVNFVQNESKYLKKEIQNLNKDELVAVFPPNIKMSIDDLIRYRNATSHKTRTPIGYYEALKSVYACFILYRWWKKEVSTIDWMDDKIEILKKIIERSKLI